MGESREYRQRARAESAARTREKVIEAAMVCFGEEDYDSVSLKRIAKEAEVGLQTVVRAAGNKEGLFALAAERFLGEMMAGFDPAALETWRDAVGQVMAFHEEYGDRLMRIMAHEHRVPHIGAQVRRSRELQRAWIEANYADVFGGMCASDRDRRMAMLLALTGGRLWYTLRRDHGLSAAETRETVEEQIEAILRSA